MDIEPIYLAALRVEAIAEPHGEVRCPESEGGEAFAGSGYQTANYRRNPAGSVRGCPFKPVGSL